MDKRAKKKKILELPKHDEWSTASTRKENMHYQTKVPFSIGKQKQTITARFCKIIINKALIN